MKCSQKVAGVVVLYNSDIAVISNIESYIEQLHTLYVVDNSEVPNQLIINFVNKHRKIIYIANEKNEGIAKALNLGAIAAVKGEFNYLLTMDDDTSIPENMIEDMLLFAEKNSTKKIGIIAPQSVASFVKNDYKTVDITITSGNLLNLKAYVDCGPFMNELFIDWVDHEYCLRLKRKGYSIFELSYLYINHQLGRQKKISLLGVNIRWTSHSPIRLYYKTRNTLYVIREYALSIPFKLYLVFFYELVKDFLRNLFLEDKKAIRIKFLLRAIVDYKNNRMGKYSPNGKL